MVHALDPATHVGPQSYISPMARLANGRNYLDRTAETVIEIEIIRCDCTVNGTSYMGRNERLPSTQTSPERNRSRK